jgi:hypothetical protein
MQTTITTTGKLTTLAMGDGLALNLPAQVPGLTVDTATAIRRALEWATPADLLAELRNCWRDAEAVGASDAQVVHHFVAWMADAGEWLD